MKSNHTFANKFVVTALAVFMAAISTIGVTGCARAQKTLQALLKEAPVVINIVNTAIDLYNVVDPTGADPALKVEVNEYIAEGVKDVNALVSLINTYQADIGSAPPGALQQADALVAAIQANEAQLLAGFHLKSTKAQSEAAAIVDGVNSFLSQLALFLPDNVQSQAPAAMSAKAAVAKKAGTVKVLSAGQLARNFNAQSKANFPQIQVAVP